MSIYKLILRFEFAILKTYYLFHNWLTIQAACVEYKSYPKMFGQIEILNKGIIKLGENVIFQSSTKYNFVGIKKHCSLAVLKNAVLEIGDNTGFSGVSLFCSNSIIIGKNVCCGGNVSIWDTDFHSINYKDRIELNTKHVKTAPIVIGNDVFIGAESIIMKGVRIGEKSIIGAGSVVTKDIGDKEIWAGNPAVFIRKIEF